jgi:cell division septation protein DedD
MKLLSNFSVRDKQALILYLGIALLCAAVFAAGIFVGSSTSLSAAARSAPDGRAATQAEASIVVRVLGLASQQEAEQLSQMLRAEGQRKVSVEADPEGSGYVVKIGPLASRAAADDLMLGLRNAGYGLLKVEAETSAR